MRLAEIGDQTSCRLGEGVLLRIRYSLEGKNESHTKLHVYRAVTHSILMYIYETWPLLVGDPEILKLFEHRCLCYMVKIKYSQTVLSAITVGIPHDCPRFISRSCPLYSLYVLRRLK